VSFTSKKSVNLFRWPAFEGDVQVYFFLCPVNLMALPIRVHEHLPQASCIADDPVGHARGDGAVNERERLVAQLHGKEGAVVSMTLIRSNGSLAQERQFAQLRFLKNRGCCLTRKQERIGTELRISSTYSRCSLVTSGGEKNVRHAGDAVHGGAEFMADVARKLLFATLAASAATFAFLSSVTSMMVPIKARRSSRRGSGTWRC